MADTKAKAVATTDTWESIFEDKARDLMHEPTIRNILGAVKTVVASTFALIFILVGKGAKEMK